LFERGELSEFDALAEGGLADEEAGEQGAGVHVGVGEEPEFFELAVLEEVGFVDEQDDLFASFGGLCGEEADSLWDEAGFVEAGDAAEGGDDRGVEPACADGGVAKVDGGVP